MKALILAAGKGTRLRPLTKYIPKPMLPLHGKPLLEWELLHLISCGISEFVIAVSLLSDQIKNFFEDGSRWGVKISYSEGKNPAGKAGEIFRAQSILKDSPHFLVVPGDTICHLDYRKLISFHYEHNSFVTIALSTKFKLEVGFAKLNEQNMITEFLEKTNLDSPVSTGAYVLGNRIFSYIEKIYNDEDVLDLPQDIFHSYLKIISQFMDSLITMIGGTLEDFVTMNIYAG